VAFHRNTSAAVVDVWSSMILQMQEDGTLQTLLQDFIASPTSGCQTQPQVLQHAHSAADCCAAKLGWRAAQRGAHPCGASGFKAVAGCA
jgi:hypothetical protein